ncbi:hypothetical protein ACHAQJ_005202 [Trichoderma viride]
MHLPPAPTEAPSPLNIRQNEFHILTQTVIRPSTTFVTTITLGTIESVASSTIAAVPLPVSHHHGLSGGQIGAILGSVVGVVVLLLVIGFCYVGRKKTTVAYEEEKVKKRKRRSTRSTRSTRGIYEYTEEDVYYTPPKRKSSTKKVSVSVQTPAPVIVSERIPGGPKFPSYRAIPISNPRNPQIRRTG